MSVKDLHSCRRYMPRWARETIDALTQVLQEQGLGDEYRPQLQASIDVLLMLEMSGPVVSIETASASAKSAFVPLKAVLLGEMWTMAEKPTIEDERRLFRDVMRHEIKVPEFVEKHKPAATWMVAFANIVSDVYRWSVQLEYWTQRKKIAWERAHLNSEKIDQLYEDIGALLEDTEQQWGDGQYKRGYCENACWGFCNRRVTPEIILVETQKYLIDPLHHEEYLFPMVLSIDDLCNSYFTLLDIVKERIGYTHEDVQACLTDLYRHVGDLDICAIDL